MYCTVQYCIVLYSTINEFRMNLHQIESDCYRGNSFETCLENRNLGLFVSASIPYQLVSWLGLVYVCNCTDTDTYFTYRGRYPSFTPVHTCIVAYIGGLGLLIHQEGSIWAQSVTDIRSTHPLLKSSHDHLDDFTFCERYPVSIIHAYLSFVSLFVIP